MIIWRDRGRTFFINVLASERQTVKPLVPREGNAKTGPEKTAHLIASKKRALLSLQEDLILLLTRLPGAKYKILQFYRLWVQKQRGQSEQRAQNK